MRKEFELTIKPAVAFAVISLMALVLSFPAHSASLADKSGKNWSFKLNALYAYDDNVVQAPTRLTLKPLTIDREDSSMLEWSATAGWKSSFGEKLSFRATYDVDMTIHTHLSEYDLTSQIFGLTPTYKITPLMNVQLDYKYIYNIVDGRNFSGIHYVSPSFNYMHATLGMTRLFYTYKNTDNWRTDARDTNQHTVGFKQYVFFANYTRRISFGYKYAVDNAVADAFDRDLHTLGLNGRTPLFFGISLEVDAQFTFRKYDTRLATDGTTRDDVQRRVYVNLSKVLLKNFGFMDNLTAKAKYRYVFNESDLLLREYRSNRVDVGLEARF